MTFDFVYIAFESITGKVVAIFQRKKLVDSVEPGGDASFGVILDRTCFYAESGGQSADEGYMVLEGDTVSKLI